MKRKIYDRYTSKLEIALNYLHCIAADKNLSKASNKELVRVYRKLAKKALKRLDN